MHTESQWRHRAYRKGLRLVKYKLGSSAYTQYGPYALFDRGTNRLTAVGLDAEAVERMLFRSEFADTAVNAGVATAPAPGKPPE